MLPCVALCCRPLTSCPGALIKIEDSLSGLDERVATISAFEGCIPLRCCCVFTVGVAAEGESKAAGVVKSAAMIILDKMRDDDTPAPTEVHMRFLVHEAQVQPTLFERPRAACSLCLSVPELRALCV